MLDEEKRIVKDMESWKKTAQRLDETSKELQAALSLMDKLLYQRSGLQNALNTVMHTLDETKAERDRWQQRCMAAEYDISLGRTCETCKYEGKGFDRCNPCLLDDGTHGKWRWRALCEENSQGETSLPPKRINVYDTTRL